MRRSEQRIRQNPRLYVRRVAGLYRVMGVLFAGSALFLSYASIVGGWWRDAPAAAVLILSVFWAPVALMMVMARGLIGEKGWAPNLVIVLSILLLFFFPLGTIAGAYSLWVFSHEGVWPVFGKAGGRIVNHSSEGVGDT